ncbi:6-phosphofructokinase [Mycoplasma haemocanis str. Illinois]|uniref:6-phosphofructokinase n=1 Tax=Mycoplasma haemocanis (strain Illinois) TaxID=1111676 RepID=H6N8H7_MYCHN|nr:ATP-dependent 6-phosphofructokinase [Mycoplasma haemocanis]AEW45949.1 6-phosphofructokinase [Mycoplasma haemocanis str. Illinois]
MENKKIAVLTSGGDSPAMNATICSFVASARSCGWDVYGVIDGYKGLIESNFSKLDFRSLRDKVYCSGTCIGSSRCLEFKNDPTVREKCVENLKRGGFSCLFVIGGDGSYQGANLISKLGFPVVAAPGTIDNDVSSSNFTIGFFSALEEIFAAVKKIRSTSDSHSQITFLEVMGRDCYDLSAFAGLASMVDYVITNKNPKSVDEMYEVLESMIRKGSRGIVVLVTERVYGEKFGFGMPSLPEFCVSLEKRLGRQVRSSVLGYVQRGAIPTSWDLFMSSSFGIKAIECLKAGETGVALGFDGRNFYSTPLDKAILTPKNSSFKEVEFINSLYKL